MSDVSTAVTPGEGSAASLDGGEDRQTSGYLPTSRWLPISACSLPQTFLCHLGHSKTQVPPNNHSVTNMTVLEPGCCHLWQFIDDLMRFAEVKKKTTQLRAGEMAEQELAAKAGNLSSIPGTCMAEGGN